MKNLKSLKETLKSNALLTCSEQKQIRGGYYTSYEECAAECQAGSQWPNPGYGNSAIPATGGCYEEREGFWDCMDS